MSKHISCRHLTAVAGLISVAVLSLGHSATALKAPHPQPVPTIALEVQDGELDHTFGTNDDDGIDGLTRTNPYLKNGIFNFIYSLYFSREAQEQTDGKILRLTTKPSEDEGSNLLENIFPNSLQRLNFDGTIDNSFAQDGLLIGADLLGFPTFLTDFKVQTDGKILVTGIPFDEFNSAANIEISGNQLTSLGTQSSFLLRILSDGTLDQSFGSNGLVQLDDLPNSNVFATNLMVQNDGGIIVSGAYQTEDQPRFIMIRLDINGLIDSTFAESGTYLDESAINNPFANNVFQQSDGKLIFIKQESSENDTVNYQAVRLTADGIVDNSYGIDGVSTISQNVSNFTFRAVMQSDNQLVFSQSIQLGEGTFLGRISADGIQDSSFATNSALLIGDELANSGVFDLAIQPDGKIVATGGLPSSPDSPFLQIVSYRFLKDGSIDETFGNGGVAKVEFGLFSIGQQVIIQPNGQIVILGLTVETLVNNFTDITVSEFALRLNSATPVSVNGVTPSRLFDTRAGSPQGSIIVDQTTYGESKELRVKVAGMSGLPEYGIGAVTINLTATEPENNGYITVYPCGTRPETSNLTFVKDQTVSTSVTTAVSPTGEFCVYSSVQTNLIADINSWSAPNAGYAPLAPQRLVDTRASSPQGAITVQKKKYGADSELRITVAGAAGLPRALMSSVSLNITVTEPENSGFLTVYPCGTLPLASNLNYVAGQTISTSVISAVSDDGEICIYSSSPTNLIADAYGWFVQGSGVTPVGPTRLVDTRTASPQGAISVTQKKYGATDELRLPLNGVAGLPDDGLGTVQLTVTADQPNASGFITVYPCGTLPLASNLNYTTGKTVAATVTTQVSTDGEICIYSNQPTNIIVDINGWGNQPQYRCGGNILKTPDAKHGTISAC